MRVYYCNAFSLNMLPSDFDGSIRIVPMTPVGAAAFLWRAIEEGNAVPAMGHDDTARVSLAQLGLFETQPAFATECMRIASDKVNRPNVALGAGDACVVAQYVGSRLPVGATSLPEGAVIEYKMVLI